MTSTTETFKEKKLRLECEKLNLEVQGLGKIGRGLKVLLSFVTALSVLVVSILGARAGWELLDIEKQSLVLEKLKIERDINNLDTATQSWKNITLDILNEPSGLSVFGNKSKYEPPMAVAIDDEFNGVFILQSIGQDIALRKLLRFDKIRTKNKISNFEIKDLEAITFDPKSDTYFAVASHRKLDSSKVMKMVRFKIDPKKYSDPNYKIEILKENIFQDLYKGIHIQLKKLGLASTRNDDQDITRDDFYIADRKWSKKHENKSTFYALEIEGAAIVGNKLLLGLKYPLDKANNAIIFEFLLKTIGKLPNVVSFDLGNKMGITALEFDDKKQNLLIAANSANRFKEGSKNGVSKEMAFGHSFILVYLKNENGYKKVGSVLRARKNAKLEGLAIVQDELWLTYEGEETYIEKMSLSKFYEMLSEDTLH